MPSDSKRRAMEIVIAVAKRAADEARVFAGEVADAAAAAAATARAAAGLALDKVATAIEASAAKGARATNSETVPVAEPNIVSNKVTTAAGATQPKKSVQRLNAKKRAAPKRRIKSRTASKKKRV
jgi:hypothetical protein